MTARGADAEIVGSYDAIRWVPEAHVIPPGLDLREFTPVPPSDNPRPLVVHAPSTRETNGTRYVIEACERLAVDLDLVEGVPHEAARERYAKADIVVDQLNAGWHGVFALEAMALGKPVVAHLDEEAVRAERRGLRGTSVPIVPATADTLTEQLRPLVENAALRRSVGAERLGPTSSSSTIIDRIADRLLDVYARLFRCSPAN